MAPIRFLAGLTLSVEFKLRLSGWALNSWITGGQG